MIELEEWQLIQISYPAEYDYALLSESTLLKLANGYNEEPNTATLAIGELAARMHPSLEEICLSILKDPSVDRYLVASALGHLSDTSLERALSYLLKYGTGKDTYLVKVVLEVLNGVEDESATQPVFELAQLIIQTTAENFSSIQFDSNSLRGSFETLEKRFGKKNEFK